MEDFQNPDVYKNLLKVADNDYISIVTVGPVFDFDAWKW